MALKRNTGVTLIELMIVVIIVGILAGIAYPSYRNYMTQSRRSDGQIILLQAAAKQEKYYSDCTWYAVNLTGGARDCGSALTGQLGINTAAVAATSPDGHYTIVQPVVAGNIAGGSCVQGTGSAAFTCGFTMTARPVAGGRQAGDGDLRIDAIGTKQRNKNGTWVSWTTK